MRNKLQLLLSVLLAVTSALMWIKMAVATEELDSVKTEASRRLTDLKRIEDRLQSDIDIYDRQIAEYQRAIEARRVALQQVHNEIKNIQIAFRWL